MLSHFPLAGFPVCFPTPHTLGFSACCAQTVFFFFFFFLFSSESHVLTQLRKQAFFLNPERNNFKERRTFTGESAPDP